MRCIRLNCRRKSSRHGAALLLVLFVMSVSSLMVISMLDLQTSRRSAVRNAADFEAALYLAGAGVHHSIAVLETTPSWRDGFSNVELPSGSGNTYSATIVEDPDTNDLIITGVGVAGGTTRQLQVTVSLGS